MQQPNRRRALLGIAAAAGVAGVGTLLWQRRGDEHGDHERHAAHVPEPPRDPAFPNPLRLPGADGMYGVVDLAGQVTIAAKPVQHALLSDAPMSMLAFEVEHQGAVHLNPVLRVTRGSTVRVSYWNALGETSNIHWHGLKVDANNDGHPHYAVDAGGTYAYQFTVPNRAATYWYHPHAHGRTAAQIHQGLAGLLLVDDDEEIALRRTLGLEPGVTDVPLVIQDKRIGASGDFVYGPTDVEWMHGYLGNEVLVNLTPRPHLDATARIYRFRLLNASNARIYRLAFVHGDRQLEFAVLGGDGGLLAAPRRVSEAFLSPGERLDVALDLRATAGESVTLRSLEFAPMHNESASPRRGAAPAHQKTHHGNHAAHHAAAAPSTAGAEPLPDGAAVDLMKIYVRGETGRAIELPSTLSVVDNADVAGATVRNIVIDHHRMAWRINGKLFDMRGIGFTVQRGAKEIWRIVNPANGMPHPMHVHGFSFRVLERSGSPEHVRRLALEETGLTATDLGWKDTVLLWPGETVRLALDFSHPFPGDQVYMFHCHNLQHADRGMMVNVRVAS